MTSSTNPSRRKPSLSELFCRLFRLEEGGALLELAVALPMVILLAVGVGDYARIHYTGITVANAARAGAVYGADPATTTDQIEAATRTDASPMTLDSVTVGRYCVCPGTGAGTGVVACTTASCPAAYGVPQAFDTVRVRKDFSPIIRYLGLPSRIAVIRTVVMRTN